MGLLLFACGEQGEGVQGAIAKFEGASDAGAGEALAGMYDIGSDLSPEIEMEPPRTAKPPAPPSPPDQRMATQRVIYTAGVRAEVDSLDTALSGLSELVARSGGFISSQHRSNTPYKLEAELVLRLPSTGLQPLLEVLPNLVERIDYQNLDSENVTEEWIDLESRLRTKREVRDRYIELLRNRAQEVEDILSAEEKIREVTEEIEAREGRLRYLRDQVSLSTLRLTLYQTQAYRDTGEAYERGFWSRTGSAFVFGWELVQGLVIGLIGVWPIVVLLVVLVALWRRRRRYRGGDSIL